MIQINLLTDRNNLIDIENKVMDVVIMIRKLRFCCLFLGVDVVGLWPPPMQLSWQKSDDYFLDFFLYRSEATELEQGPS